MLFFVLNVWHKTYGKVVPVTIYYRCFVELCPASRLHARMGDCLLIELGEDVKHQNTYSIAHGMCQYCIGILDS